MWLELFKSYICVHGPPNASGMRFGPEGWNVFGFSLR